jgi:hypothetical protein
MNGACCRTPHRWFFGLFDGSLVSCYHLLYPGLSHTPSRLHMGLAAPQNILVVLWFILVYLMVPWFHDCYTISILVSPTRAVYWTCRNPNMLVRGPPGSSALLLFSAINLSFFRYPHPGQGGRSPQPQSCPQPKSLLSPNPSLFLPTPAFKPQSSDPTNSCFCF